MEKVQHVDSVNTAAAMDPRQPSAFGDGRFQVVRKLGEGGQKAVYLVLDTELQRECALALLKTDSLDEEGTARVLREAQSMASFTHPNVVTVFDIGEEEGRPFTICEYVGGGDLHDAIRQADGALAIERVIRIAIDLCRALTAMHSRGILHRDIKPANIWLTEGGSAKLGDFGLAAALGRTRITQEGTVMGTAAYIPPEQALGGDLDTRSDLYGLGCVLYEMMTGRQPFIGDDVVAVVSQHIHTAPVAPSWHNADVPRDVEGLTLRLLAKNPDKRPATANEVMETLTQIVARTGPLMSEPASGEAANPLDRLVGGVYVGREEELRELRRGIDEVAGGGSRLALLGGEPGIGKTRMAEELSTYARMTGMQALWGRCYEGEGAPAYWPWVQAIRGYVHERDAEALRSEMGSGAADIAQLVSEVRERLPDLPVPPELEPDQARFRLFDSVATFLRNASRNRPIFLVLDDLHWADRSSLLLMRFVVRVLRDVSYGGPARVFLFGLYRDVEIGRQHPLAQTLADLAREQSGQRLLLRGLSEHDVARFIEMSTGQEPSPGLAAALFRQTEGNPFFVTEIVRLLAAEGRFQPEGDEATWPFNIPQSVREVIGRRLDRLSEQCNRMLTIASVMGREFDIAALETVSDAGGDQLLELLEEALAARVILDVPNAPERYSFSHALVRETLYKELTATRRVRLHRQIGEALERQHAQRIDGYLAELAYHFRQAALGGVDIDKAIDYAVRAGGRATERLAYEDAAVLYEHALQALALKDAPAERERCELQLALAEARWRAGEPERARQDFLASSDAAREVGDADLLARIALGFTEIWHASGEVDEARVVLLDQAIAADAGEGSALRARLMGRLARSLYFSKERDAAPISRQAVEMARRSGDAEALADALAEQHWVLTDPDDLEERVAAALEIVRLAEALHAKRLLLQGHVWLIIDFLQQAAVSAMDHEIEIASPLSREVRLPLYLWLEALFNAARAIFEGRFEEGERLAQEALRIGQRVQDQTALEVFGIQLFAVRWAQGRLQEIEPVFATFAGELKSLPAFKSAIAFLYSELGRTDDARRAFDELALDDFANIERDGSWLMTMSLLASVCAQLTDRERAATIYRLVSPFHNRVVLAGEASVCNGAAARYLGLLATTLELWDDAEGHFEEALAVNERLRARPFIAYTQYDYARMLVARERAGDHERARSLLDYALATAQELGMRRLEEQSSAVMDH